MLAARRPWRPPPPPARTILILHSLGVHCAGVAEEQVVPKLMHHRLHHAERAGQAGEAGEAEGRAAHAGAAARGACACMQVRPEPTCGLPQYSPAIQALHARSGVTHSVSRRQNTGKKERQRRL